MGGTVKAPVIVSALVPFVAIAILLPLWCLTRVALLTKKSYLDNAVLFSLVVEAARYSEQTILVLESDLRGCSLRDAVSIVEIQRTTSLAVATWCNNNIERLLAHVGGRVARCVTHRNNRTTTNVERDIGEVHVGNCDVGACTLDSLERLEVIESVVGEVNVHTGRVLLGDRSNQDSVAIEELEVKSRSRFVMRVLEEHGADEWK